MYKSKTTKTFILSFFIYFILFNFSSCTTFSESDNQPSTNPALIAISFYQSYISPVDGHRCRMYPSCSEYSRKAFKQHGFFKGWIITSDRLLRCGRNEMTVSSRIVKNGKTYCDDSLENNDFWWYRDKRSQGSM